MSNNLVEMERTVTETAIQIINLRKEFIDEQIEGALRRLVLTLGFDRSTLVQLTGANAVPLATHCWAREGYPVRVGYSFAEHFPYIYELMSRDCLPQFFPSPDALPDFATVDKQKLHDWGPHSMFCLPLNADGKTIGWITIGTFSIRKLAPEILDRLSLFGSIFAGTLSSFENVTGSKEHLLSVNRELRKEIDMVQGSMTLVGESPALRTLMDKINQVATSDSTVLILGETGTGKELVARRIHALSSRSSQPMFSVNCAGLAPSLIEDELFGHERGAYTGAIDRKKGRFEVANGTSLFLDEIGELPITAQAKLLRVLEERRFERLGSTQSIHVNVRILAATNRDLSEEIRKGCFREDLYYRLGVFLIHVPPLRERLEDIPLLVDTFVQEQMIKLGKSIKRIKSADIEALQAYSWPGNVRELRNVVERACILAKGPLLSIPAPIMAQENNFTPLTLMEVERNHILESLRVTNWRVSGPKGAAKLLGLNAKTLESRMRRLGIVRPPKQAPDEYFDKTHIVPTTNIRERRCHLYTKE